MRMLREWLVRVSGFLRRGRPDADLEQELLAHLELAKEAEGRRAGRWGGVPSALDAMRDQRSVPWLEDLSRDVRHELRSLRRHPTLAAVVLLTLAVGIGANTATFSVVNSVLLRPLAYPDADELVALWHTAPGAPGLADVSGDLRLSASMYFTYAQHNQSFQHLGLWLTGQATVTGIAEPELVRTLLVTDGTLQALGVQPALGRWLNAADQEPGGPHTVMLTYGYWQRRFGGDPAVIGRSIIVNANTRDVVGVMPAEFRMLDAEADLIAPLSFDRNRIHLAGFGFQGLARLKPGITIADAAADVSRMIPIWMNSWPAAPGVSPRIYESWRITPAVRPLQQDVVGEVGNVLWIVMGTVGIVMLIVCANVANLLLVRTEGRHAELALRASLGAGRGRILRGLLIESVTLAFIGGVLGLAVAYVALRVVRAIGPDNLPRLAEISIDHRTLTFTLVLSLVSGMLFGLIPAIRYSSARMSDALRASSRSASTSRTRHRARSALIVAQVALALLLLVSSGLMIRTFQSLRAIEPGFARDALIQTVRTSFPPTLVADSARAFQMQRDIVDRLSTIGGVAHVSYATDMPMEGVHGNWDIIEPEGITYDAGEIPPLRVFRGVSPGFFATTGTRVLAGRDYTWTDLDERRPVVIVSENIARQWWGSPSDALDKRVRTLPGAPWQQIIGVVEDVYDNGVHEPAPSIVYWPVFGQSYYSEGQTQIARSVTFAIRSERTGTADFLEEIEQAVWAVNASLPLASVRTLREMYERSMARTSFTLVMLALAGAVALLLGVVGIYGVVAYTVSQRTREIGIRVAVGARPAELTRMFVRHALLLAVVGVAIGLVAAAGVTQLLASQLFGISPLDPMTYAVVPPVLLATVLVASYLPARRVAAVDPVEALKVE